MVKNHTEITFFPCAWDEIQETAAEYCRKNQIIVESYWEDHVLSSNHYKMLHGEKTAGFFAVHGSSMLTLFYVLNEYAHLSQELFARVKKYEQVTHAMVPTGDEFFLSHAIDNYVKIEKQAYFSVYARKEPDESRFRLIEFRLADINKDEELFKLCGGFLDEEIQKIRNGTEYLKIYIAELAGKAVGFGITEHGRILTDVASIGMYVFEEYRRQGIASSILYKLRLMAESNGFKARSGCWYYNHNSKKSMENAGAFSKSRLLKFYF